MTAREATMPLLHWTPEDRCASDPIPLAPYAGHRVELRVGEQQVALLLRAHAVISAITQPTQTLQVGSIEDGWGAEDDASGFEARMNRALEELAHTSGLSRLSLRYVSSADSVLFVRLDTLPDTAWGDDTAHWTSRSGSRRSAELRGRFQVGVSDPILFYDSFLRRTEDLEDEPLHDILARLIHSGVSRALEQASDVDELLNSRELLKCHCLPTLRNCFATVGVAVHEFEIDHLRAKREPDLTTV